MTQKKKHSTSRQLRRPRWRMRKRNSWRIWKSPMWRRKNPRRKRLKKKKNPPPQKKASAGRGRGGAFKMPTALTGELSEYEKIRQGNIAEREAMLQALMADFDSFKKDSGIGAAKKAPPKKRKRVEYDSDDEGGSRGSKVKVEGSRKSARLSAAPEDKGKVKVEGSRKSARLSA